MGKEEATWYVLSHARALLQKRNAVCNAEALFGCAKVFLNHMQER